MEIWRDVVDYEGLYEVSSHGRVRNSRRVLTPTFQKYWVVELQKGDVYPRRIKFYVHVLVAEAFLGPRPYGMQACHNDGDPRHNNTLRNLRWDTVKANALDRVRHQRLRESASAGS
jgi:hypothetical protein